VPLYEYKCGKCGEIFEELVSLSSPTEIVCPKCGSKESERVLSAFSMAGGGASGCAAPSGSGFS